MRGSSWRKKRGRTKAPAFAGDCFSSGGYRGPLRRIEKRRTCPGGNRESVLPSRRSLEEYMGEGMSGKKNGCGSGSRGGERRCHVAPSRKKTEEEKILSLGRERENSRILIHQPDSGRVKGKKILNVQNAGEQKRNHQTREEEEKNMTFRSRSEVRGGSDQSVYSEHAPARLPRRLRCCLR